MAGTIAEKTMVFPATYVPMIEEKEHSLPERKILILLVLVILFLLFFTIPAAPGLKIEERGTLAIFFMEQKVGYEEYTWSEEGDEYILRVSGRMEKPVPLIVEKLVIRLNRDFIARQYDFKGSVNGVVQEVASSFEDGIVKNIIRVMGQENRTALPIRGDALLLPNAVFSPYLVLGRKLKQLGLGEKAEFVAYLIPQMEIPLIVERVENNPCQFVLNLGGTEAVLETDEEGNLLSLNIPSQKLRVTGTTDPI